MVLLLLALSIGLVAGLRALIGPAALSWAAHFGWLSLDGTRFAFLGNAVTPWLFSALALFELVTDQLPTTPSRKTPVQFVARLISGGFCGAAIGASGGQLLGGLIVGVLGAYVGTLIGAAFRARLAEGLGGDRPAALIEDAVALGSVIPIAKALT